MMRVTSRQAALGALILVLFASPIMARWGAPVPDDSLNLITGLLVGAAAGGAGTAGVYERRIRRSAMGEGEPTIGD